MRLISTLASPGTTASMKRVEDLPTFTIKIRHFAACDRMLAKRADKVRLSFRCVVDKAILGLVPVKQSD